MNSFRSHRDNQRVLVEMWTVDAVDGDHSAAALLSQLLWWFQLSKGTRQTRVRYEREGELWLIRSDDEWFEDCRLTQKQVRRVRKLLLEKDLIVHRKFQVYGAPTGAWRPNFPTLEAFVVDYDRNAQMGESNGEEMCFEGESNAQEGETIRPNGAVPVSTDLIHTPERSNHTPAPAKAAPEVEELCEYLALRIARHRGDETVRPKISAGWHTDMRLLLERGPVDIETPKGVSAEQVRRGIDFLFDQLNVADGGRRPFCWANVIQSPNKLRAHWTSLVAAARQKQIGRVNPNTRNVMKAAGGRDPGGHESDAARLFRGELNG